MTARPRLAAALLAAAIVAAACVRPGALEDLASGPPSFEDMARALGTDVVQHLRRGYVPGRSGEILLIPEPWNVIAQWSDGLRGPRDPRTTHATPWAYHQRVPLILYGPGYVPAGERPARPVDLADVAPTIAALLDHPFEAPDGRVLREALLPSDQRADPPRVVVVVVQDGGGWNVLEHWTEAWPVQRRLADAGTTYVNATIGSAPSVTAPVHSTIGAGAYPRVHGIAENTARLPDGSVGDIYLQRADPSLMEARTVADVWDRANRNRPWVGMLGYESWHLGMMGRGAADPGGDPDVAVLWERDEGGFWTNEEVYRLPPYLPGREDLDRRLRRLDASDGVIDGAWGETPLEDDVYLVSGTPAFVEHQGEAILEMLRREPIGRDELTDLLFVEFKPSDLGGHVWNMLGEEEEQILQAQDRVLGEIVGALDRRVGRGRYIVVLTADHGQTPFPEATGGLRVDRFRLEGTVNDRFGARLVEAVHPSEVYLDLEELRRRGVSVEEVAERIADQRYGDVLPPGVDREAIPPELRARRVFAAALPSWFIESLTDAQVRALGPGAYAQGDLTTPPPTDPLGG